MLQTEYSEEGQQRLRASIRNSLLSMETALMHFDWVKEERELEGERAIGWNDLYKRFQLLSISTKDACSYIEKFARRELLILLQGIQVSN
jgi:hypothetical protein